MMSLLPIDRTAIKRIAVVTDFGHGPYVGQMRACLDDLLPSTPVIDLMHDLPPFRADLAAYLLPALTRDMPEGTLYLCVVDPGVGGERAGLVAMADERWFVAPDNGLLMPSLRRAEHAVVGAVGWRPERMTASFHGRDWFAPMAARLCRGDDLHVSSWRLDELVGGDWPAEASQILYVDRFGNLITGLLADGVDPSQVLLAGGRPLRYARTFSDVPAGQAFWYENALGLVEIAVNQGRADLALGLGIDDPLGGFEG